MFGETLLALLEIGNCPVDRCKAGSHCFVLYLTMDFLGDDFGSGNDLLDGAPGCVIEKMRLDRTLRTQVWPLVAAPTSV